MQMIMVLFIASFAFVLTVLMLLGSEDQKGFFSLFASVMWFVAAGSVSVIHETYTIVRENSENSGQVVVDEGVRIVTKNWPMTTLFIALGLLCLYFFFMYYMEEIRDWLSKSNGGYGGGSGGYS